MTADAATASMTEITTPCIRVCKFNELSQCFGCFRTGEEVRNWKRLSSEDRCAATEQAALRKAEFWAVPAPA
jgi:predicted Fe-S protein YdhL (DUF1289 family)